MKAPAQGEALTPGKRHAIELGLPPIAVRTCVRIRSKEREMPQFDAYEDLVGKWRWRLLGADGHTIATAGESYDSHWHALRAAENVRGAASAAKICSIPANGVADALAEIVERELAHG
jgi:uncharacterized protein YegP (UPF0339 family)